MYIMTEYGIFFKVKKLGDKHSSAKIFAQARKKWQYIKRKYFSKECAESVGLKRWCEMRKEDYKKILQELIQNIDEGVYIVDKKGVGKFYNNAMASMEKVNVEDVLDKKFHGAFPEFLTDDSTMFKALIKGEATRREQQTYKNFYGKEITTINSTMPIVVNGEIVAALEVAKDITDIRRMSDTLLELQKENIPSDDVEKAGKD